MGNTFQYLVVGVAVSLGLSFLIAYHLDRVRFGHALLRALYFVPHLTTAVAMAWVWRWLYQPVPIGVFNGLLVWAGLAPAALPALDGAGALRRPRARRLGGARVPGRDLPGRPEGHPAGVLRGGGHRRCRPRAGLVDVTLPLLRPTLVFLVVVSSIAFLRIFDYVYSMTHGQGGPLDSTKPLVLMIYETAFGHFQMGYAAAQTVVLFVILLAISLVQLRLLRSRMSGRRRVRNADLSARRLDDARGRGRRGRPRSSSSGRCCSSAASLMVMPFVYMLSTSLKSNAEVYELSLLPADADAGQLPPPGPRASGFPRWFLNSLVIAVVTTLSVLFFDSLVGYTLAKFRFRGRRLVFLAILSTLMIPTEMLVLPWYVMSKNLGWLDTYWGIMFPGMMTGFGTFLMRQFFEGVPDELLEAARVDGLGEFRIWWRVAMPLVGPALSALAIFTFLGNWTAFLWPLIATTNRDLYTLPVGLASFSGEFHDRVGDGDGRGQRGHPPDAPGLHRAPEVHRARRHAGRPQGLGAAAMTVASRRPRPSPVLGVQEYASGGLGPASLGCSVLAPARGVMARSRVRSATNVHHRQEPGPLEGTRRG